MSETNETTLRILDFLLSKGIYAYRANVAPLPILRDGKVVGFRPGGTSGVPDVIAIFPPVGRFVGIEIKTGKDTLRQSQITFHAHIKKMGGVILVVKTFEDFLEQFTKSFPHLAK